MILLWKIRYLDTNDRKLKDRNLYIDTKKLEPELKHSVKFAVECQEILGDDWAILPFRKYFQEINEDNENSIFNNCTSWKTVGPCNYHENENGNPISPQQLFRLKLGKPNAIAIPQGFKYVVFPDGISREDSAKFNVGYLFPISKNDINLSQEQIKIFQVFSKSMIDLTNTTMYNNPSPFSLTSCQGQSKFSMSVSTDDFSSYVTCFRKLYMEKEPANFVKTCNVLLIPGVLNHPVRENILASKKASEQFKNLLITDITKYDPQELLHNKCTMKVFELINCMLYTKFIHQPDEKNKSLYQKCLDSAYGNPGVVQFLFCRSLQKLISNYVWVAQFVNTSLDLHRSSQNADDGIVYQERPEDRIKMVLSEKIDDLSEELWIDAGRPSCGQSKYRREAKKIIQNNTGYTI